MSALARHFWDLDTYREAFEFQQELFSLSQTWPRQETYALTDQARRSSRSIGANLAEGWAKRRYPAHFLSKLTDCDGELQETRHWLRTAEACGYMRGGAAIALDGRLTRVGRMLGQMISRHDQFTL